MDHMTHSSNLHWSSYGTTPDTSANVGPSPQTTHSRPVTRWTNNSSSRGSKRAISESDCDDVYSEESSKDPCTSPGDSTSCYQMLSRKKRRGVIEKKRRDRINTSLTELKRLVPSAYEKQGSAKLEKAEILQMTVDHLKMLHAKGLDNLAYDPHKFAMDYHIIGFRECASEVARYLVTIEGMDIQDPLRLRLMSHLQCFVTQRELASKQAHATSPSATSTWNYPPPPPSNHHPSPGAALASNPSVGAQHYPGAPAPPVANPVNLLHHHSTPSTAIHHHSTQGIHHQIHDPNLPHHYGDHLSAGVPRQPSAIGSSYTTSTLTPLTSTAIATTSPSSSASTLGYHHTPQYHNLNSYPTSTPSSISNYNQNNTQSNMKPYRPWGAEVAY